jgi:hypothetical protein
VYSTLLQIRISLKGVNTANWFLDLTTAKHEALPFSKINPKRIDCVFEKLPYAITTTKGVFSVPNDSTVIRMQPEGNSLLLNLSGPEQENK